MTRDPLFCTLFLSACMALSGCGADQDFRQANFLERVKRYPSAVSAFESFVAKHPEDARAGQALVRAGRIYVKIFSRCTEAKPLYERAARRYQAQEPWASLARQALLDCPEYLPLRDGARWQYVDSQTHGKNMRLEVQVRASTDGVRGEVSGAYYAGSKRVRDYVRSYVKEDWAVWELLGTDRVCILKYPFTPGMSWTGRREGHVVEFRIESDRATVTLPQATYQDCLKVREATPGVQAWKYDYYAPGVGRVKTTIGVPGAEHPNTELKVLM